MDKRTEIVRGSELDEEVIDRIFEMRNPDAVVEFEQELKRYENARRSREETEVKSGSRLFGSLRKHTGFYAERTPKALLWEKVDEKIFVVKPEPTRRFAYEYMGYQRYGDYTSHARNCGLLAGSRFNREISHRRVEDYVKSMEAGEWRDLLSDPITITDDGEVVNGQHRLAAASKVDWEKASHDPLFLVVWGVAPEEALHADLSRRTTKDQATIASKVAGEFAPSTQAVTKGEILDASVGVAA